jgi:uncharacterized protein YjiK
MPKQYLTTLFQVIQTILFLSCLTTCSQDNNEYILYKRSGYQFPYHLVNPDKSWELPESLVEISGLSYIDNNRLACIQDESGIIYVFNQMDGKVEREIYFGNNDDYEDIQIINDDAWVLKSNGTLYKVTDYLKAQKPEVKNYPTALSGKNDTEGLAYDPVQRNLLIACKEHPYIGEIIGEEGKAIYSFDPENKSSALEPFLLVKMDTIKYYKGDSTFAPSGVAIHPITGNIFILGSVGRILIILSRKGEMRAMIKLNPGIFRQPEGICFSPDGILYIASEGDGIEGTLLRFEPE